MYHILFIYSSADGQLGCLHFLAIMNNTINICVQVLFEHLFSILLDNTIPWWGIAGSYGNMKFNFWSNCQTVFQSSCTILHEVPISHILANTCIVHIFYYSHLSGCEVVFHCGFDLHVLMTNDVEHLFMCLLAIFL